MYIKYPKTCHLPFSQKISSDDKILPNIDVFKNKNIIITIKYDGENITLYQDYIHSRSLDFTNHSYRDWIKKFHSTLKYSIPTNWRICGEYLYATHKIKYNNLKSYFYGFSVYDEHNICLSWDDTLYIFNQLNIIPVETIYQGIFDINHIENLLKNNIILQNEGFVIRNFSSFKYNDFNLNVAKFVNKTFNNNNENFLHSKININTLIS